MGSWFRPERHSNTHAPPVLVHYSHHLIYQANFELVIFWIRYIPVQDDCDKVVFWSRPDDIKRNFRWYSGEGAWEAGGAQNCSRVRRVTMTTLWAASTQAPSHCQPVETKYTYPVFTKGRTGKGAKINTSERTRDAKVKSRMPLRKAHGGPLLENSRERQRASIVSSWV